MHGNFSGHFALQHQSGPSWQENMFWIPPPKSSAGYFLTNVFCHIGASFADKTKNAENYCVECEAEVDPIFLSRPSIPLADK
jgi:hypothetical protein